ncbi:hypothetical protein ACFP47_05095 [Nesterenkonia lacusekhoensis]
MESDQPGNRRPGGPAPRGPRDYTVKDGDLDDFTPPNPGNPLAGAKPGVALGALLSLLGILALVVVPFLPISAPSWTVPALIGVVLLGLVILFLQMPRHRSGGGDGAQV